MVVGTTNSTFNKLHNNLLRSDSNLNSSIERISSGKKITKASDSPSELAVLAALQAQTRGITQQISNGMSEISMLQTAEGALDSTSQSLQRMSELSVQAANGTLTDSDRSAIMAEIKELSAGIDKTASSTEFNSKKLLDGSLSVTLTGRREFSQGAADVASLGLSKISVADQADASKAIESVKSAIDKVSSYRSQIGATVNGINSEISNYQTSLINTVSAQSQIEDVDMAAEIINMNRESLQSKFAIKAFDMQNVTASKVLNLLG